ncbi:MAG: twin-arginine translocase TatA/TatE family subunit [Actinomycetes bacterium]|nr:twin-arginine translocase TatA/TatE family subunit [Actinomycetes bacterium]
MPFLKGIGWPELIIILVVVLIIFGPKQLPKLGKMFGKTVKEVRTGMEEATREAEAEAAGQPQAPTVAATPVEAAPIELNDEGEGTDSPAG